MLLGDFGAILSLLLHLHIMSRPQHIRPGKALLLHALHLVALTLDLATHESLLFLGDADGHLLFETFLAFN